MFNKSIYMCQKNIYFTLHQQQNYAIFHELSEHNDEGLLSVKIVKTAKIQNAKHLLWCLA